MARTMQAADLETRLREYEATLRQYVRERPLTSVAAAFGVGYVLGGGLTPRVTWLALTTAARLTFTNMLRNVVVGAAGQLEPGLASAITGQGDPVPKRAARHSPARAGVAGR
jgi:hypothetical protein